MKPFSRAATVAVLIGGMVMFGGCAQRSVNVKSSVIDYLYGDKEFVQSGKTPVLNVPLKIGIAFVPESNATQIGGMQKNGLSEKQRLDLMQRISSEFKKYGIFSEAVVIPSANLTPRGSFVNLSQIRALYGIDQILLISYDQSQFTDEGASTAAYWTGIGAYVVAGEKNGTHTMVEANVFDIPSQKMLFRSVGVSSVNSSATLVNLTEQTRTDSVEGFNRAGDDLLQKLDTEIVNFKSTLK
ncbi:MAG: rhombotarget lipoprotein [Sulfuricurvum sp.]